MNRRAAEHQAQTVLKELEEEIKELKQRSTTLSQLALSEDYLHFLKVQSEVVPPLRKHATLHFTGIILCFSQSWNCTYRLMM